LLGSIALVLPDQMPAWVQKWDDNGKPRSPGATFTFLGFALASGLFTWLSLERVDIDAVGITSKRPGQQARHLAWGDIHRLRERLGWLLLELHGDSGQLPVRVPFLLKRFFTLRDIILENAPGLTARAADASQASLPMTFPCGSKFLGLLVIISCLNFAFACWVKQANVGVTGFMAVGLAVLVSMGWAWHSLTVDHDRIILHRLVGRREIPFAEMIAVSLKDLHVGQPSFNTEKPVILVLHLKDSKPVELHGIKDGLFVRSLIELAIRPTRP